MFQEAVADATGDGERETIEAATLLASFEAILAEAVEDAGVERVVEATALDPERVSAVKSGDSAAVTVETGATILATARGIDAEAVVAELRDHLLLGMTTAVLDVDTIAGAIDADLTGQEVQQALEGRADMTLAELAEVMAVIEGRKP
ncbi:DUF5791 family protein [Halorubrum vacuolatum]|uniref:Uncharacterized protein n=1 Tax=Halorubrum vacuolatum TaxID=63740 RepID=A0A238X577_HALVU|nr:DUF5791 family protein [Halorubrum vacuolatum]SNR53504.1 hypothetical protein SAMN06264855_11332 [Halorubrum vacuolatum]